MSNPTLTEHVEECTLRDDQGLSMEHRPYFARSSRGIDRLEAIDDRSLNWPFIVAMLATVVLCGLAEMSHTLKVAGEAHKFVIHNVSTKE